MFKEPCEIQGLCRNCKARKLAISSYSEQKKMFKETYFPEQIEFGASVSLETNRIPDFYLYYFSGGKLISPITNAPVEDEISRRDALEEGELQAFRKIQTWVGRIEEGTSIWISPREPDKGYKVSKIIFSEIVYDLSFRKLLLNRGVCLDWDMNDCLSFARTLGFSEGELRNSPIFLGRGTSVADILEPYDPRQAKLIRENEDFEVKERLKAQMARGCRAPVGLYDDGCRKPMSAFNLMYTDSLSFFDCPRCDRPIPYGRGITTCPHCGARKENYKSCE